jgi:hypothetical protein
LADFVYGKGTISVGVADALVNRCEGFFIFALVEGWRVIEVDIADLSITSR